MSIIIGESTAATANYKESAQDLCRAVLDDPELKGVFSAVEAFMADKEAMGMFSGLQERGEALQVKQQGGLELTAGEVAEYDSARDAMLGNPKAKAFVDAQEKIQEVHQTIGSWVSLVFELGRMPNEDEMKGSCGEGCGCH